MFQTEEINIREYIYVLRKWQWMIIAFGVVFTVYATYKASQQIPIYRATVRLMIGNRMPAAGPFAQDYYWDSFIDKEELNAQYEIIRSRMLAKRIAQRLGKFDEVEEPVPVQTPEARSQPKTSIQSVLQFIPHILSGESTKNPVPVPVMSRENRVISGILGMISVRPVEDSRLVDVSVTSTVPEDTVRVANILAEEYIAQDLESKNTASKDAVRWLVEEVETARQKVADSELALLKYKEEHALITLEDQESLLMEEVLQFTSALNEAKITRIEAEAQFREIKKYSAKEMESFPEVIDNWLFHNLKVDLTQTEQALAEARITYREQHPQIQSLKNQMEVVQTRIDAEIQNILTRFAREYEMAVVRERELAKALEEQKQKALKLNHKAITYSILANEIESNRWVYHSLLQKMKEMSINERLETSNIRVIDQAIPSGAPINSGKKQIVGKWLALGLILGIGLAFGFEYLDNSIKTPEDIKQFLGIQFLGFIPKMTAKARKSFQPEKVVVAAPQSVVSEAYRSVRTSVTFSALPASSDSQPGGQTLLVTSAEPSEGKSCTVANLAIAMAQSGKKTLIIDCDFRRPQIHKVFDIDNEHGFADLLSNFKTYGKIRIKRTEVPNLDVFPCGHIPSNPSELLELPTTPKIIRALATRYDMVLIDSPPINSVTDPVILSRLTQGVVMVIRAGETKRDMVQRATEQLADAGANILGGVINNVDIRKNKYYYYYAYHYSHYYKKDDVAIAIK